MVAGSLRSELVPAAIVAGGLVYGLALLAVRAITLADLRRALELGRAAVERRLGRA